MHRFIHIRKRIIQICRGGMSISVAITIIIISVNWIAIFRYNRIHQELYGIIVLNLATLRETATQSCRGLRLPISRLFFSFSPCCFFFSTFFRTFFVVWYNYTVSGITCVPLKRNGTNGTIKKKKEKKQHARLRILEKITKEPMETFR